MNDTHFLVPEILRKRVVRRDPSSAFPYLGTDWHMNNPTAASGVYSTALDIAVFAQMCLNGGRYKGAHVLSRASIKEMTRNQIPGIGTTFFGEQHLEASWGYGWSISGNEKWRYYSGALVSAGSYSHGGAGGVFLWVDPAQELVGVYLSVLKEKDDTKRMEETRKDLFANAVTAAIEE
jgi:CubicO group peptidase (beta-lactamase class C family)